MIRRTFLMVVAVAFALILTPNVAMAYNAVPYNCTVSDTSPTSGVAFDVNCVGVGAGQGITLTPSSGGSAVTNKSNTSGAVSFTVTLTTGTHTLTVKDANGETLGTLSVNVGALGAAAGTGAGSVLANTGSQPLGLAVGGGLLVLVGAGAVLVTRRRKLARVRA